MEFAPDPALVSHVECIWTLDGEATPGAEPDRVIPDGRAELIWNLADRFRRWDEAGATRHQASALLVGQITTAIHLAPGWRIALVAVRFRPAALGSFLGGIAAAELTDRDVAIRDVVGRRLREVEELLWERQPGADRVSALQAALAADLAKAMPVDRGVAACVDVIMASHGRTDVEQLARLAGVSRRQLERRFLAAVGVGPKRLARIARFQHLLARIRVASAGQWSGLAIACGYYDQAHLIRDFREFAQCTPSEYLGLDMALGQLFLGQLLTARPDGH
jgi:AraC-like DNA-binding protein